MTPHSLQADVFAYGIILCETIARVPADPDYLPRTEVTLRWEQGEVWVAALGLGPLNQTRGSFCVGQRPMSRTGSTSQGWDAASHLLPGEGWSVQVTSEPIVSLKRRAGSWIQAGSRSDICVLASPNLSPIWSDIRSSLLCPSCNASRFTALCNSAVGRGPGHAGPSGIPGDPILFFFLSLVQDFGLDVATFRTMVEIDCPAAFLQLAFHCCSVRLPPPLTALPCQDRAARTGCLALPAHRESRELPLLCRAPWGA